MERNPENSYTIKEKVCREGIYGELVTTVITRQDGTQVRKERFIPSASSSDSCKHGNCKS